jgi:hypothetical protein
MDFVVGIVRSEIQDVALNDRKPQIGVPAHVLDCHQNIGLQRG